LHTESQQSCEGCSRLLLSSVSVRLLPNLSWCDSRPYAVLQRTLDKDCRQAEEPKQLVDEASRFHLGCQRKHTAVICSGASAAEYCAPVRSRPSHTSQVDMQLNFTMRLISSLVPSVLHFSHGFQCYPTLNASPTKEGCH